MNCNEFSTFITVLGFVFLIVLVLNQEPFEHEPVENGGKNIVGIIHPPRAGPLHYNYAKPEYIPAGYSYDVLYEDGTIEHH